jgi:hypothetical protein
MKKSRINVSKSRAKKLKNKYENGTLTKNEQNEWWPYRLKQMRDEYYRKNR